MIDYPKLLSFSFKVLGIVLFLYGMITIIVSFVFYIGAVLTSPNVSVDKIEFSWIVQIVTGAILFLMSQTLTSIVLGHQEKDDQK